MNVGHVADMLGYVGEDIGIHIFIYIYIYVYVYKDIQGFANCPVWVDGFPWILCIMFTAWA